MKIKLKVIFVFLVSNLIFSQDKSIKKEILDESCDCIGKIDVNLKKGIKNDSIKSCIINSIIKDQTTELIKELGKSIDTLLAIKKDTVLLENTNFKIEVDKDYTEIQSTLMKECPNLKLLLNINNEEHKNSYSNNKKALEYYKEGEKYFNQQKYDLALVEFNNAIKKDSKFAFAWDNMGICYRRLDRYEEAIKCYKKSLELDANGTVPLMNMAVAYNLLGKNKLAIETYEQYIKLHPNDPEGYYGIARLQNFSGDYSNALENALNAFVHYDKMKSPYSEDALNVIREIVVNLKKEKKINIFNEFAEKHGIEKIKE